MAPVFACAAVLCALAGVLSGWPPQMSQALRWLAIHLLSWVSPQLTPVTWIALLFAVFVGHHVWRELHREAIIIEPFEVPRSFQDAGLTSQALASRIGSALEELESPIKSESIEKDALNYSHLETRPDIEIPQTKMGLRALIEFLRDIRGLPMLRITGDVVESPVLSTTQLASSTRLTLTVYGNWGRNQVKIGQTTVTPEEIDLLVERGAELALECANPYRFGRLMRTRGRDEDALKIAQRMVDEHSNETLMGIKNAEKQSKYGHLLWALILYDECDYENSLEQSKMAVDLDPQFAVGYASWGRALGAQGLYKKAIAKCKKAIKINQRQANAYFEWGYALQRYANSEKEANKKERAYTKAITKFRENIELDPRSAEAYYNWGDILLRHGQYAEAIAKFEETIKIHSRHANAYYDWGCALLGQELIEQAKEKFKEAIKIDRSLEAQARVLVPDLDLSGDEH